MIRRSTWILLAVFAVALAGTWYWQRSEEKKVAEEPTPTEAKTLLDVDINNIRDLKIEDAQGKRLNLRKVSSGLWIMTEPERQNVDLEAVNTKIDQLTLLSALNTIQSPPTDEQIGLAAPAYKITVTNQDGKDTVLEIGEETPTQSGYYLRLNGTVYVISKASIDALTDMLANPPIAKSTQTPTGATSSQGIITATLTTTATQTVTATP